MYFPDNTSGHKIFFYYLKQYWTKGALHLIDIMISKYKKNSILKYFLCPFSTPLEIEFRRSSLHLYFVHTLLAKIKYANCTPLFKRLNM